MKNDFFESIIDVHILREGKIPSNIVGSDGLRYVTLNWLCDDMEKIPASSMEESKYLKRRMRHNLLCKK